ncbi:protein-lysine N-methyltransferase EEF2KMT [Nematolebias whitei]|uniref:protein-lysine N-methyltransferase EEF2KMT n=1 Tax=Nematolebias whitei TaxID=451745 RepID=UPI001896FDEE|nr:protein-lysine N-methyltransferase EEF2KMT [Nematolebias whitei]
MEILKVLEDHLQSSESAEFLLDLMKQTCLHPLSRKFPPSVRYRRLFLCELIKRTEAAACDPLDQLYEALAEVVGVQENSECYKNYFLPGGDTVSLQENVVLISEGTTGLVTWEAALYLTEWVLENPQVFTSRSVLELGSGAGLTGISICRCCRPSRFSFSDCHASVLQNLRDNVRLNGLSEGTRPAVRVDELDWTAVTEDKIRDIGADTIIAADVVYDPDVAGSLVTFLSKVLNCASPQDPPDIFICSTIRNPETYGSFIRQLETSRIGLQVMSGPVKRVFPYNRTAPIELIRLFLH